MNEILHLRNHRRLSFCNLSGIKSETRVSEWCEMDFATLHSMLDRLSDHSFEQCEAWASALPFQRVAGWMRGVEH